MEWDEATEKIILCDTNNLECKMLSLEELLYCAETIKSSVGINIADLLKNMLMNPTLAAVKKCAEDILKHLPVLVLNKAEKYVAVDLHNFVYKSNSLDIIMNESDCGETRVNELDDGDMQLDSNEIEKESNEGDPAEQSCPGRPAERSCTKRGRRSIVSQFPQIVESAIMFIQEHSYSAHERRRESTASCGVSLKQIRDHLLTDVDGLSEKGISIDTVHRLMEPPRKGTIAARNFTSMVSARVPHKKNNLNNNHMDIHYCRSAVKLFCEMFTEFADHAMLISCDDMNKLNVGTSAVSRYHQLNKIFMTSDSPNILDHDFPEPNSKLNPSGYMVLENKDVGRQRVRSRSMSPSPVSQATKNKPRSHSQERHISGKNTVEAHKFIRDKYGRLHYKTPKTGSHYIYVRPVRYHNSSAQNHANDLYDMLFEQNKKVVGIISDGGPDWSVKSLHNLYIYGRLWYDLDLNYLGITQHAPGNSKENPIEHGWSPRSKDLTSVVLPRRLDVSAGQDVDVVSFDNAVNRVCGYWRGKMYDTFPMIPKPVLSKDTPHPYNDFDELKNFFGKIKVTDHDMKTEMAFFLQHSVRRCHGVEFVKCTDSDCKHCYTTVREQPFMAKLREFGGHAPFPMQDRLSDGHYASYLGMSTLRDLGVPIEHSDHKCPSIVDSFEACTFGCNYVILSQADKERHIKICHYEQNRAEKRMQQQIKRRQAKSVKDNAKNPRKPKSTK